MEADVRILAARDEHALHLALNMRAADVAECDALGFDSPYAAVKTSLDGSEMACALLFGEDVAAIFGLSDMQAPTLLGEPRFGCVWFLTSTAVDRRPKAFLRAAKPIVGALLEQCPKLMNMVDARHAAAIRFVRWLGAEILEPRPFGAAGLPFHPVILRRSTWAQH